MKKQITYLAFLSAVLVGGSGCNKRPIDQDKGEKYPVQFNCQVTKRTDVAAGKVTEAGFEAGDVIGIYSYSWETSMFGEGEFTKRNVPYVQQTIGELLVKDGLVPLYFSIDPEAPLTFKGYYPYSDQMTDGGVLALDMADQSTGATTAILYSNNAQKVNRTANYVSMEFGYVMAQVIINIQYDPVTMPGGDVATVSAVTLTGDGLHTACEFHMVDGSVTTTAVAGGGTVRGVVALQPGVGRSVATVVPETVLNLNVNIVTATHTYSAVPKNIIYEAGYQYTYNVTLKGGGEVLIGDAIIMDWEPGNHGGEVIPGELQ